MRARHCHHYCRLTAGGWCGLGATKTGAPFSLRPCPRHDVGRDRDDPAGGEQHSETLRDTCCCNWDDSDVEDGPREPTTTRVVGSAGGDGADKLSSEVVQLQAPATSIVIVAWWDAGSGRDSSIWIQEGFIPCVAAYY